MHLRRFYEKNKGGEVMRRDAKKYGPSHGIVGNVTHRDEYSELVWIEEIVARRYEIRDTWSTYNKVLYVDHVTMLVFTGNIFDMIWYKCGCAADRVCCPSYFPFFPRFPLVAY